MIWLFFCWCKTEALKFLLNEKETKNKSKMANLNYSTLEMQPYLQSDLMYNRTKKFLFKLRTRMVSLSYNFGKKKICKSSAGEENQEHLLEVFKD